MKNSSKNTSNKNVSSNVSKVSKKEIENKEAEIKEIDLSKVTHNDLLEMDLDKVNLYKTVSELPTIKIKDIKNGNSSEMYKNYEGLSKAEKKKLRTKAREKRDKIMNSGLFFLQNNEIEKFEKEIVPAFLEFYKETYTLNDFSIASLGRANSDESTTLKINKFLTFVKANLS